MIRQTKNYLVGALSGVTVIGIAIGAFVVIVSAQVFHEWPIADTGSSAAKSKLAPAKSLGSFAPGRSDRATAATGADPALRARGAGRPTRAQTNSRHRTPGRHAGAKTAVSAPANAVESPSSGSTGGDETFSAGGNPTRTPSKPASPPPSSSSAGSTASGGNPASAASTGSTGSNGSSGSAGQAGAAGGSNGSSGGTTLETPVTAVKTPPPASEAVNEAVHEVDESATGGTLEKTGVTEVTEPVVEGVVGPETPVGKTAEGAAEAVGGLLGGSGSNGQ